MSLHDRIMALDRGYEGGCFSFNDGYGEAKKDAARIAKAADELIDWVQSDLETLGKLADSASSFSIAQRAIDRIEIWKEQIK